MKKIVVSISAVVLFLVVLALLNPFRTPNSVSFVVTSSVNAPVGETQIVANVSLFAQSVNGLLTQGNGQVNSLLNELGAVPSVSAVDTAASLTDQVGTAQYSKTISIKVADPAQSEKVAAILERSGASIIQTSYSLADPNLAHAQLNQQASQLAADKAAIMANSYGRRRGRMIQLVENQGQTADQTLYTYVNDSGQTMTELRRSYSVTYSIW